MLNLPALGGRSEVARRVREVVDEVGLDMTRIRGAERLAEEMSDGLIRLDAKRRLSAVHGSVLDQMLIQVEVRFLGKTGHILDDLYTPWAAR